MADNRVNAKITTGIVRLSYAHIFTPGTDPNGVEKYSASLIIPKSDKETMKKIDEAIDAVINGSEAVLKTTNKAKLKLPVRDGDEDREGDTAYAKSYFLNAKSNKQPQVVDKKLNAILDADEVYSGCYVKASISFYAYNTNGSKGVAVALNAIQKIKDGEPLGGGVVDVRNEFSVEDDDDDDDMLG